MDVMQQRLRGWRVAVTPPPLTPAPPPTLVFDVVLTGVVPGSVMWSAGKYVGNDLRTTAMGCASSSFEFIFEKKAAPSGRKAEMTSSAGRLVSSLDLNKV
ncbi:hypothetical protein AB1Y20_012061 [Prymnesium parvum]|uniref:Uncharacterized protein n=1 Tax=Prymnesium parvum TaxID=97485 RepID=A0AB34IPV3_PRYPA